MSSSVYDAYGAETNCGTLTDPFGYNAQWGYWYDRDTGMYLCQARWYDPVTARWVTRDPIGYAGGANLYGYCGGGPVGWADPSGLQRGGLSVNSPVGAAALVEAETGGMGPMGAISTAEWNQTVASTLGQIVRTPPAPWIAPTIPAATVLASECYSLLTSPTSMAEGDPGRMGRQSLRGLTGARGDPLMPYYKEFVSGQQPRRHTKDDCEDDYEVMLDYIQNIWLRGLIGTVNRRILRDLAFQRYAECLSGAVM